ncbi:glycosyltransferase [Rubrobacter taiwanensis]|uniref:Glycosyltransferase n=1 Tax=Rubrobacter taiwanensis TaxID=185139 RepID=A0A4R1BN32_9ACTN|nr:glycosyltransferase [Rubrobacter taiwanensis]
MDLFEPDYVGKETVPGFLERIRAFISVQAQLWRRAHGAKALYIRAHPASLPTALWARARRMPVVQELNGPYEDLFIAYPWTRSFAPLFRALIRVPLAMADALIVVTPQLRDWAWEVVGQKPTYVIPNGANTKLFHPNSTVQYPLPKPYVVFFGALARWQGVDTLLQAVERPEWPTELNLVIVGDGVERAKVQAAATHNPKVVYMDRVPYSDVPGIIANSIAGLSPKNGTGGHSKTGLFPLKVFETLACGVPVVVTDFPGQANLVQDCACGLVVPPEDPVALAQAVDYLYRNPDQGAEMGFRGRKAIEQEHSWDRRAEETAKILTMISHSSEA